MVTITIEIFIAFKLFVIFFSVVQFAQQKKKSNLLIIMYIIKKVENFYSSPTRSSSEVNILAHSDLIIINFGKRNLISNQNGKYLIYMQICCLMSSLL